MFVGREKEIRQIQSLIHSEGKSAALIYGKRRIGKSTLIQNALSDYHGHIVSYECLNASYEENLVYFESRIREEYDNRYLHFSSFQDAFAYLSQTKENVVVVLDEYSYLKMSKPQHYVDSVFQSIIDSMGNNIHLFLLGSYVGVMQESLEEENPLFGRFQLVIHLKELNYYACAGFYSEKDVRGKIELYSVFGGNPFVNVLIDPKKDLKDNVISLLLNENSAVRTYLENVLLNELSKTGPANLILTSLSNGKKKYSEISAQTRINTAGVLDKQLKNLIRMDILERRVPINRSDDRKKVFYEIGDNLVRFYYSYIFTGRDVIRRIGEEAYYDLYIQPSITTFISYRFEDIARQYFERQVREGKRNNIYDIGTYWYDDAQNHQNGEFDCVLKHKSTYSFYEVKYYEAPLDRLLCEKEEEQVRKLAGEFDVETIGFISLNGFSFRTEKYDLICAKTMSE